MQKNNTAIIHFSLANYASDICKMVAHFETHTSHWSVLWHECSSLKLSALCNFKAWPQVKDSHSFLVVIWTVWSTVLV